MAESKCKVLVEEILEELAHANVRPSAVDQQQTFEEAELSQSVITSHHCLHAFLAADADTNVSHCIHMQHTAAQNIYTVSQKRPTILFV